MAIPCLYAIFKREIDADVNETPDTKELMIILVSELVVYAAVQVDLVGAGRRVKQWLIGTREEGTDWHEEEIVSEMMEEASAAAVRDGNICKQIEREMEGWSEERDCTTDGGKV